MPRRLLTIDSGNCEALDVRRGGRDQMRRTADVRGGDGGGAVRSGRTATGVGLAASVHDTRDGMAGAASSWLTPLGVIDGAGAVTPSTQQWPPLPDIRTSSRTGIAAA